MKTDMITKVLSAGLAPIPGAVMNTHVAYHRDFIQLAIDMLERQQAEIVRLTEDLETSHEVYREECDLADLGRLAIESVETHCCGVHEDVQECSECVMSDFCKGRLEIKKPHAAIGRRCGE